MTHQGFSRDSTPSAYSRGVEPNAVRPALRVVAWFSFLAEVTIIATGGAVRLTGSGLGCSEWPMCTPGSLVPTPELGIHGLIEFGNRTMTGVVGLLALAVVLLVWRIRRERRDLFVLAAIVLLGVVAQAIVGGITVWTGLNPFVVGFHYTASLLLVCVSAAFLVRMYSAPGARTLAVPVWFAILSYVTGLTLAVTIVFGVLTTASGPHSGDANVIRDGFDATVVAHVHSWPGYALAVLVLLMTIASWVLTLPTLTWVTVFAAVLGIQITIGVWQSRGDLPPLLVGIHMVLGALCAAAYAAMMLNLKQPIDAPAPRGEHANETADER